MASKFEQAVWGMRAGLESAAWGERLMHEAAEKYAGAEHHLTEVGSDADRVTASRHRLALVQEALGRAYEHLEAGREEFAEYLSLIGASGVSVDASAGSGPTETRPEPVRLKDFSTRRPHAGAVSAIHDLGWPKNKAGNVSVRGNLYDGDGNQVNDRPLKPWGKGEAPALPELREPWASDPDMTTTWHAERDAAKIMRDRGLSEAALYLNIPTCGKESGHPQRCHSNIEKIMPKDAVLLVWSVSEDGGLTRRRYVGTGEAIKND